MDEVDEDRRRYFRVIDQLPLYLEPLDAAGVERLHAEMEQETDTRFGLAAKFAATTNQLEHVLNRIKEHQPDVALYLQSINGKLDDVAKVLLLEEDRVARMQTMELELSASGLRVTWPEAMEEGQLIRVELITAAAHARVLGLGRVIRCTPAAGGGEDSGAGYGLAIDFEHLGEHDEDLIMQEVMRRQAALLRERRAGRDD